MLQIIGTIIFGAIIGVLARAVLPGRRPYGWIVTCVSWVSPGALIGYWVWGQLGGVATPGASTGSGGISIAGRSGAELRLHRADPAQPQPRCVQAG